MSKKKVEIVVLSDIHLGTYGCRAEALVSYLKSIQPSMLILNGDIIDIWQFSKRYWPRAHMQVIKEIVKIAAKGVPVYYLTGNHDELLRKFSDFSLGNFHLVDQLLLQVDGKKHWFFHGDVFDASLEYAKWLAKLGAIGYDFLIILNNIVNWGLSSIGKEKMSFSKKVKNSVKTAVSYISDFEQTATETAIDRGVDYVVCGHIHQPQIKYISTSRGEISYLNSGDWIENLTALEYNGGQWSVYTHVSLLSQEKLGKKKSKKRIEEEVSKKSSESKSRKKDMSISMIPEPITINFSS